LKSYPPFVPPAEGLKPYYVEGETKVTPPLVNPCTPNNRDREAGGSDYLLALETSGKTLSFALLDHDYLVSEVLIRLPIQNKDGLALWIQNWFHDLNVAMEQLNGVAVSCGPGSFTGLRVGMSLAKGICLARNIPLWAVPTLQAMAHSIPPTDRLLCPTTIARNKECYAALFRWDSDRCQDHKDPDLLKIREVEPPFVADAQKLAEHLSSHTLQSGDLPAFGGQALQHDKMPPTWIYGEGALGMRDDLQKLLPQHQQILTNDLFLPRASSVARLAYQMILKGEKPAAPDLEPFYLKRFPG